MAKISPEYALGFKLGGVAAVRAFVDRVCHGDPHVALAAEKYLEQWLAICKDAESVDYVEPGENAETIPKDFPKGNLPIN